MAGYNRPGFTDDNETYVNATAFNSQIASQREELKSRHQSQSPAHSTALGVSNDNTQELFSSFNPQSIMTQARLKTLVNITTSENPDFRSDFNPSVFKSLKGSDASKAIIYNGLNTITNDGAKIGVGPNLSSQSMSSASSGVLDIGNPTTNPNYEFSGIHNEGYGTGFGWFREDLEKTRIGGYLSAKYRFDSDSEGRNATIQGERRDTNAIDYVQPISMPQE